MYVIAGEAALSEVRGRMPGWSVDCAGPSAAETLMGGGQLAESRQSDGRVMEMSTDTPRDHPRGTGFTGYRIGIHPEQLCFERFMGNPFDL